MKSFADIVEFQAKFANSKWEFACHFESANQVREDYMFDRCIEMYYNDQDRYDGLYEIWFNNNDILTLNETQLSHLSEQIIALLEDSIDSYRDMIVHIKVVDRQAKITYLHI